MNKLFLAFCFLLILVGCVQDSPNIKQIENLQFFIDNKSDNRVTEIKANPPPENPDFDIANNKIERETII